MVSQKQENEIANVRAKESNPYGALPSPFPQDGMEGVDYRVEGCWGSLNVDSDGSIRLWRLLDRERPGGPVGVAEIISVDRGRPPLSATATLTITVTDVNDCPPRLLPPTVVHVMESSPPSLLATLTATDPDVWALGHGPPFNFSLADTNPTFIIDNINLFFNPREYFILLEIRCPGGNTGPRNSFELGPRLS